jgi:glycosyltransferase involved in cell wall biosynthesis
MKRIAILTPGDLPVPAVLGGAIETLTTHLLNENETAGGLEFTVLNTARYQDALRDKEYAHTTLCAIRCGGIWNRLLDRMDQLFTRLGGYRRPYQSVYLRKVCRLLKREHFDEVLIEGLPRYAWRIWTDCGIKPILHLHTDLLNRQTRNGAEILASCKQVLCVSRFIADRVAEIPNRAGTPIRVLHNCVDTQLFQGKRSKIERADARRALQLSETDAVFLFSGRLHPQKGVRELLAAFEICRVPNKKLLLVGGADFGNSRRNAFVQELERFARRHAPDVMLTGYVPNEQVAAMLAAADVYVAPSLCEEAAHLGALEACCTGVPCVASNRGGIPEYAVGAGCLLVDLSQDAPERLARAMEEMFKRTKTAAHADTGFDPEAFGTMKYYERFLARIQE